MPLFLFGQNKNEIKFDVFGLFQKQYQLSYERIINENFGVEVKFRFLNESTWLDTTDYFSPSPVFGAILFDKTSFHISVHGKYYLNPKPSGNRLMLGAYLKYVSKPNPEAAYGVAYEMYKGEPPLNPTARSVIGVSTGYKFLILKKRFVIEPVIGIGGGLERDIFDSFLFRVDGFLNVNLGYRF